MTIVFLIPLITCSMNPETAVIFTELVSSYYEENSQTYHLPSLIPRPLPDFILQPQRKSGEGLGSLHRKWWTRLVTHGPEMVVLVSTNRVHHFPSVM